eukprot:COSAG04_NODE_15694_length_523_cov_1.219340_1_plen_90_part_10
MAAAVRKLVVLLYATMQPPDPLWLCWQAYPLRKTQVHRFFIAAPRGPGRHSPGTFAESESAWILPPSAAGRSSSASSLYTSRCRCTLLFP